MILIADSGSTKTHWTLIKHKDDCSHYYTQGINPFFQTEYEIEGFLRMTLLPELGIDQLPEIYFYGAGCATEKQIEIVRLAFSKVFRYEKIEIASDLLGAARALCGDNPGIACILGTGSNSCYYDGKVIKQQVSPLGFIIGDEGSGASLGKRLVADCLKNQLPAGMKEKFLTRFDLTQAQIVENVYRNPFPSRFLASLSLFLEENIDEPAIYKIVYDGFSDFFKRNVFQYDYKDKKVNVVGSVGFFYRDILQKVAEDLSVQLGKIIQAPTDDLIIYHTNRQHTI
jgi:N-acetylglucosamine kinase-like BadF-type ATPase